MMETVEKLCMIIDLQNKLIEKLYSQLAQHAEIDAEIAKIEALKKELTDAV